MSKVIVVGAGPSGLMAAYIASFNHRVLLFEKNDVIGKKLVLTGHGRCNITNACTSDEFFKAIVSNPKFLYSAFHQFSNQDMIDFLNTHNLPIIEQENGRCFPESQSSKDVISFFKQLLQERNVEIHYNEACINLVIEEDICKGITTEKDIYYADTVIVCTGGISFRQTGSTGDGHKWAEQAKLNVTKCYPGLSSFLLKEPLNMTGLSLKNIGIKIKNDKKVLYQNKGDILFTHQGISGPVILNASSYINKKFVPDTTCLYLDLLPNQSLDEVEHLFLEWIQNNPNKNMIHALDSLFPKRWNQHLIHKLELDYKKANEISKQKRLQLAKLCKEYPFIIHDIADFSQAMITQGGISIKEINPKTMECKKIRGLKFAGEVLDLDAQTGGYNLQIAWTTGYVAGITA